MIVEIVELAALFGWVYNYIYIYVCINLKSSEGEEVGVLSVL